MKFRTHRHPGTPGAAARVRTKWARNKGSVLVLFALVLVSLMATAGLVVDLGLAYVTRASLSKAVDAGALAGARHSSRSESEVRTIITDVADANYPSADENTTYEITITTPSTDTRRVFVNGESVAPAFFSRVLGKKDFALRSVAEATRYPLDMSLVLDLSLSLERNNAFDDLQRSSKAFLEFFNESVDQFGLVTYSTWATEELPIAKNFKTAMTARIDALSAISDTNIEEGLRVAKEQLDVAPVRDNAVRVVVLFTDGRPTAFADNFRMPNGHNPLWYEGIVATYISGSSYRGLFYIPDGRRIKSFSSGGYPKFAANDTSSSGDPKPKYLPGGGSVNGDNIRDMGALQSEAWANTIRNAGYTIFAIGLGNPNSSDPGDQPDLDFLRRIANQDGMVNGDQPEGDLMFAPTPDDLDAVFAKVADRILTRLTR